MVKPADLHLNVEMCLFNSFSAQVAAVIDGKNPSVTFHVDIKDGGRFYLYFANCEAFTPVSFSIRVEQYNLVGPNGRKDYLSVGETELNVVYWVSRGRGPGGGGEMEQADGGGKQEGDSRCGLQESEARWALHAGRVCHLPAAVSSPSALQQEWDCLAVGPLDRK
jgi:hypothetical protein